MDTQKKHFCHTVSQSSVHLSDHKHDNTNLSVSQGLHSNLFRDQLYLLNVPEECKFLWIIPIDTHKHLNRDPQMHVFTHSSHVQIFLFNTILVILPSEMRSQI